MTYNNLPLVACHGPQDLYDKSSQLPQFYLSSQTLLMPGWIMQNMHIWILICFFKVHHLLYRCDHFVSAYQECQTIFTDVYQTTFYIFPHKYFRQKNISYIYKAFALEMLMHSSIQGWKWRAENKTCMTRDTVTLHLESQASGLTPQNIFLKEFEYIWTAKPQNLQIYS